MGRRRVDPVVDTPYIPANVEDPELRQMRLINLAERTAEKQMLDGTASSAVICHYLKLATEREQLEQQKLKNECVLAEAKAKSLEASGDYERVLKQAMEAFTTYRGSIDAVNEEDDICEQ